MYNPSGIPPVLLLPLYGRAQKTCAGVSILNDSFAVELIGKINYDIAAVTRLCHPFVNLTWLARAKQFDLLIESYILGHPRCTVINLGAGLDTRFQRVDNGSIRWLDVELPAVAAIRTQLMPDTERSRCIACSMLDEGWIGEIQDPEEGVYLHSGGCLIYLSEAEIRRLFDMLHRRLPGARLAFDTMTPKAADLANSMMEGAGIQTGVIQWHLADARSIEEWDSGVRVLKQFRLFEGIDRADIEPATRAMMDISDRDGSMTIVECEV